MTSAPHIRPETLGEEDSIEAVTIAAFLEAEHSGHNEHHIVRALRRNGALSLSLVAIEEPGNIIGHVAVSPVKISDGARGWYGLGPLSVLPARQRRGTGTALMERALSELRTRGAAGCVLLGDPRYYGRFGFSPEKALVLPGAPAEYFQALKWRGESAQGVVQYHEAFQ